MARHRRNTGPRAELPSKRAFARQLRRAPTEAEAVLWQALRKKQLAGYIFRRQHVVAGFIVDLYCARADLAVEVDGLYHNDTDQQRRDLLRTRALESAGLRVLRVTNEAVLTDLSAVLARIAEACGGQDIARHGTSPRR